MMIYAGSSRNNFGEIPIAFSSSLQKWNWFPCVFYRAHKRAIISFTYLEGVVQDVLESISKADFSVGAVFEKFQILGTVFEGESNTVLEVIFGKIDIIREVRKANLGFDHPKFRQVTSRVRVFGTKGGSKGVDIRQGAGMGFDVQLSGNGQVDTLSKEIVGIVNGTNHVLFDWFCGVALGRFGGGLFGTTLEFLLGNRGRILDLVKRNSKQKIKNDEFLNATKILCKCSIVPSHCCVAAQK